MLVLICMVFIKLNVFAVVVIGCWLLIVCVFFFIVVFVFLEFDELIY